jgi:predicted ATPase
VPLFAEELIRTVLESHPAPPDGGELPELEIPETLQDSLMARLDALGPVKELAQLGAVLGREFSYDLLLAVSPLKDAELRAALAKAVREELFYQRGIPPEASYLFKHALLRDAAYQSVLRSARRRHHARIGETLVQRMPRTAEAQPELVAHHLTEGGEIETAIGYWQRAGERATRRMANAEATLHLRKGLDLVEQLPPGRERDQQELRLQIALGAPLMALEGYSSAMCEQTYGRARELCERLGALPEVGQALFGLAIYHYARGQLRTTAEVSNQLLEVARRSAQDSHRVLGHLALGMTLFDQGEMLDAIENLERAVELYEPSRDRALAAAYAWDPDVLSRSLLARALAQVGHLGQALVHCQAAIERGRASPYAHSFALATMYAALVHQIRREVSLARRRAEEAYALSKEQALVVPSGATRAFRGWALATEGSDEGLAELQAGLSQLAPTGFQLGAPLFLGFLAEAQRALGRHAEVLGTLDAALGIAAANDNRFWDSELLRLKGEQLLAEASRAEEGEGLLRQAVELSRGKGWRTLELRAATSLARLWRDQGKRSEARELLAPVYAWFTEGFDTLDLIEAKALLDELGK